jgi:hypothetical protein
MSLLFAYLLPDPEQSAAARTLLLLAYVATAVWWLGANRRARLTQNDAFSSWWLLGAVLLFLLAINKLFNLRRCFEDGIRALAKSEGWYDRRQPVQFVLAVVFPAVLAVLTAVFLATKARRFVRENRLALVGWVLLLLYLALRQTQEWEPVLPWLEASRYYDWRFALEVSGILLVALAALVAHPPGHRG